MSKDFSADLHIHTCLSPCADLYMTPASIVNTAITEKLDVIAITDHNSAENVRAAQNIARNTGLTVLAGMEVTSSEEVHVLALFDDAESALKLQDRVYEKLPPGETDGREFGEQVVVNESNEVVRFNKRLLISATSLPLQSIVEITHVLGGIAIASHVDREAFGIISQLGFIPGDLPIDALEISPRADRNRAEAIRKEAGFPALISSSDAHCLDDIGRRRTRFVMNESGIAGMISALKSGDAVVIEWDKT
jgi:PHP family Zn ribbon phosphoesterase